MGHVSGSMLAGVLGRVGLLAHLSNLARARGLGLVNPAQQTLNNKSDQPRSGTLPP